MELAVFLRTARLRFGLSASMLPAGSNAFAEDAELADAFALTFLVLALLSAAALIRLAS